MPPSYTIGELGHIVGGKVRGDESVTVTGVADLWHAERDQVSWVSNAKFAAKIKDCHAAALLVTSGFGETPMPAIVCERIDRSVALLFGAFSRATERANGGVHATAVVHESAEVAKDASLGPHVVIEANASVGPQSVLHAGVFIGEGSIVGERCEFWPGVVVRDGCLIGDRVVLHPNVVIGGDGLGFYFDEGCHQKVPHIGGVKIEDDVEIGACTCIDRAKIGHTRIGRGTKIDNLVHLAHNVQIGEHCMILADVVVGGSTQIGNYAVLGGRAGISDNLSIGDGVRCASGLTIVTKDVPPGATVSGFPAQEHRAELRMQASLRKVPAIADKLKDLVARVKRLEASAHDKP